MDTLGSRLRYIRKEISRLNQSDFAKLLEIPLDSLGRYERDAMNPSADIITLYVKKIDFSPEWLLTGEGDPLKTSSPQDDVETVLVPLVNATLSAGGGSFEIDGNVERYLSFRYAFLKRKGSIKDMIVMAVAGDSMEPEIKDKDTVLIDQSQTRFVANGIYAVAIENMLYLKKVNARAGKIILESINPDYPPMQISPCDIETARVLGRAIWWCREAV